METGVGRKRSPPWRWWRCSHGCSPEGQEPWAAAGVRLQYERTMARAGDRGVAEADLMERRERVSALDVRPLSRADHASLRIGVDEGAGGVRGRAVGGGHGRGRADPAGDGYARLSGRGLRRRAADVSVEHPDVVENYRSAHPSRSRRLARIRTGTPRRSARWSTTVRCSTSCRSSTTRRIAGTRGRLVRRPLDGGARSRSRRPRPPPRGQRDRSWR